MIKTLKVQTLEDVKFEQSPKGKGFKEAKKVMVLSDAASKDEFVVTLHGNNAVKEFLIGEIVAVNMKARSERHPDGSYTQLLDATHIEVVKREIKHSSTAKNFDLWDF